MNRTMMTVPEIITKDVIESFVSRDWASPLDVYLTDIADTILISINVRYKKLIALDTLYDYSHMSVADYLYFTTKNEIERIFQALIVQYNPKFTYDRTIQEINSGENNNTYSGSDNESLSGSDVTTSTDNLDVTSENIEDESTAFKNTYDSNTIAGMRPTDKVEAKYKSTEDYDESYNNQIVYGKHTLTQYGKALKTTFGRTVNTRIEGTNGVYPFPDLIAKEYGLRVKYELFNTIVDSLVKRVSAGVWDYDDCDEDNYV